MSFVVTEDAADQLVLDWPNALISTRLSRFRDFAGRGLSAELTVTTTAPGFQPLLTQATLNLSSLRTRAEFARRLKALFPDPDWDTVLEQVCVLGLRHQRRGEPVLRLDDDAKVTPPTLCVDPLVYDGLPTVLFGPGGIGKSYLSLIVALLVESGGAIAGLSGRPGPVLMLDYESEYADLVERARQLRRGHPELGANVAPLYRRCHLPLAEDLPALQRVVAESQIKLLVIDSLGAACGSELERAETAIRLFGALRSLRVAALIVAHVAKNSEEKTVFGSVFFTNFARSVWEMRRAQEAGESVARVGLYHRKSNLGPLHAPIGLRFTFGDAVQVRRLDLQEEPVLAEGLPLSQRIRAALRDGVKSARALSDELEASAASVKARLSDGQGKWCVRLGDGNWGLLNDRF